MKKTNKILNIWYGCWLPLTYLPNWWHNIKTFFRNIKYSYQRIKYGFCERDTWDLYYYYTNIIADTLDCFVKNIHGYPAKFEDNDSFEPIDEDKNFEDWKNCLSKIAVLMRNSIEDYTYKNKYEDAIIPLLDSSILKNEKLNSANEEINQKWLEEENNIYNLRQHDLEMALDLLKEHWFDLWD